MLVHTRLLNLKMGTEVRNITIIKTENVIRYVHIHISIYLCLKFKTVDLRTDSLHSSYIDCT